jgi:hypothetical protein
MLLPVALQETTKFSNQHLERSNIIPINEWL